MVKVTTNNENEMTILSAPLPVVRPRFAAPHYASWQDAMKDAVRDADELCELLDLPADASRASRMAARQFPLFVPRGYIARMRPGDPADPLLRQVLPLPEELTEIPGFIVDPVDDASAIRQPGLLQKYSGRVLLVLTGTCAVHCRYCFRRNFSYASVPRTISDWRPAFDQIAADPKLREVILSGGDPLTLVDCVLAEFIDRLAEIPHVRRLRIHTRLPIMIPQRVTDRLIELLKASRLTPIVVLHANHANELDGHVEAALAKLVEGGIVLLNQAVLLAGVNDSLEAQAALCERLVDLRVMPYYLHQLDRVVGAAHFEVPIEKGRRIIEQLRAKLPGYAVPRYVAEVAGEANKTIIA
jgi:EF-P beta-lysylation protein EpmB